MTEQIRRLEKAIEELAGVKYRETEYLTQIAGVGTLTSLTFILSAGYFGTEVNDQSLTPGANPRLGPTRFEDWLSRTIPQA